MGVILLRAACAFGDPGPQPLRYAGIAGRQLYAIAADWPELLQPGHTGIYQALGREKIDLRQITIDQLEAQGGFDGFKPAQMVFEHLSYGPFSQQAIAFECTGPCAILEADELAGPLSMLAALDDLGADRCTRALVGAYTPLRVADPRGQMSARAWLVLLQRNPLAHLRWRAIFGRGQEAPSTAQLAELAGALGAVPTLVAPTAGDPLGLGQVAEALAIAQGGATTAVWRRTVDGRALLLGFHGSP